MSVLRRPFKRLVMLLSLATTAGVVTGGTAMAYSDQHIHYALRDLNNAYHDLEVDNGISYGGHREAARSLVAQAIQQVQAAIATAGG